MEKIYSRIAPGVLLHVIHQKNDFSNIRENMSPDEQFLQASAIPIPRGKTIVPHKHIRNERKTLITQESLIIIEGAIEARYYDLDNSLIQTRILNEGDLTITFLGGHSFRSLSNNTKVYELKNGPYLGKEKDNMEFE